MNLRMSIRIILHVLVISILLSNCSKPAPDFEIEEATIAEIHNAFKSGSLTSYELTDYYLKKIEKYDKSSGLNSIVVVNENALDRARELDEEYKNTGKLRPLHGIPIIVKDVFI